MSWKITNSGELAKRQVAAVFQRIRKKRGNANDMIEIKIIDKQHQCDINIPNEPVPLFGRMIPTYMNEEWSYSIERFSEVSEMTFPDENYSYDELIKNSTFIGAYDGNKCIGLAIMQEAFFKHMYLYDLKVNFTYRKQRIATKLIEKAMEIAKEKGYIGIFTQGQDNNLGACLFYINTGFEIGGFDKKVYEGTKQEGKADIWFYKK